ncbi:MAG: heme exporter protein CcmD [Rhodospirillaceae bacterium]|nr:heme exporter protein CcmD [Rhodospirillaceae bacterium]
MDSLTTFFEMGGYAAFVWSGYGLTAVAMIGLLVGSLRTLRAREKEFAAVRRNRPTGDAQ